MAKSKSLDPKVKAVLDVILEQFKTGNVASLVAFAMFPTSEGPSKKWSFLNRMLMFSAGTNDARTFMQWKDVGRRVLKGAKAFYILTPLVKTCSTNDDDGGGGGEEESRRYVYGYRARPVFRYEDTVGRPLEEEQSVLKTIPFYARALEWGIQVETIPVNTICLGCYSQDYETIALASPDERVFFHELAHAAHKRVLGDLKTNQNSAILEIVAELATAVLCRYAGKQINDSTGNSYQYIEKYAGQLNLCPYRACQQVLSDTEQVLALIIHGEHDADMFPVAV